MKKFLALMMAVLLLISAGSAVAEILKCPNCGAEFNPELGYIYCPFCATPLSKEPAGSASDFIVGDVIIFGRYEQDNNLDNGPEPIEWIVLDVQDGKALLLSKYGLEAKPYNTASTGNTWENCTLRAWLNIDFLNKAFSAKEQSAILTTEVDNSARQGYSEWSADSGNNTQDRIFLLSYTEANRYLGVNHWKDDDGTNTKSRVAPTEYAIQNGAFTSEDYKTADGSVAGWWWLRSPGDLSDSTANILLDGSLDYGYNSLGEGIVRPALWLNLESADF